MSAMALAAALPGMVIVVIRVVTGTTVMTAAPAMLLAEDAGRLVTLGTTEVVTSIACVVAVEGVPVADGAAVGPFVRTARYFAAATELSDRSLISAGGAIFLLVPESPATISTSMHVVYISSTWFGAFSKVGQSQTQYKV